MQIPENTPTITLTGILVNYGSTQKGSNLAQVLIREDHMGIRGKVHLIDVWGPENSDECSKLVDKPVQFAALKSNGDDNRLYRVPKGTRLVPLKG